MRKSPSAILFGLIPAILVAGAVLLVGTAAKPARFTARTTFAVDWNAMPSVPNDEQAEKVRAEWRKQLVREVIQLPSADAEIADILERANALTANPNTNSAIISELKKGLRIVLSRQTAECDQFTIEVRNSNTNFAHAAALCVLQGITSKIKTEARTAGGLAAWRSYENVEDVIQKKDELRTERRRLQNLDSSYEARQRIQEIDAELGRLEWDHTEAGFGLLGNLGQTFFSDPVRVVEEVHIERSGNESGFGILFTAAILGCAAGMVGFVSHRFASVKSTTPRAMSSVLPMIPTPPPIPPRPPLIPQSQSMTPRFLPPPVPVQPRR